MELNEIIKECHDIIRDPKAYLRQRQEETGCRYMGYTCPFAPGPVIHAADYVPVRIFGFEKKLEQTDKYLPSNCCEFAKNITEFLGSSESDFLEGMLFTHCCDTLQVVTDISERILSKPVYRFNLPTHIDSESALMFTNRQVTELANALNAGGRTASEDSIEHSWAIYRRNGELLRRLYELRAEKPGVLSGTDAIALMIAGHFMPKEQHNLYLEQVITELENREGKRGVLNVVLSGFNNGDVELIRLIESCGCNVIYDDLCETSRGIPHGEPAAGYAFPDSISGDIASCYCPAKTCTQSDSPNRLLQKIRDTEAKGVIFFLLPFCDPQAIEYAGLKRKLNAEGIRSLVLEPVFGSRNSAQLHTRIEAFLESLQISVR
ncbi:2-hydroxyacyl-CoA dehydratase subunit D [Paenibacillus sp. TH7-28]